MTSLFEQLLEAQNAHDPRRMASLFADDYESFQPVHPNRGFSGSAQVFANWSAVFEGVPDFTGKVLASCQDGDTEWGECEWRGHHRDGSPFAMSGVIILTVRDGLISKARLYMEPVEVGGGDIEDSVRELYKPGADE